MNPNESKNPPDFKFAKIVRIQQHSDLDSNSVTSLFFVSKTKCKQVSIKLYALGSKKYKGN